MADNFDRFGLGASVPYLTNPSNNTADAARSLHKSLLTALSGASFRSRFLTPDLSGEQPPITDAQSLVAHICELACARQCTEFAGIFSEFGLDSAGKIALLQAVSARLGDDWCRDDAGFVTVTIALSRLQRALHSILDAHMSTGFTPRAQRALIVVPAGEQHVFSANMFEAMLITRGWSTSLRMGNDKESIADDLKQPCQAVCLSWSDETRAQATAILLEDICKRVDPARTTIIAGGAACLGREAWLHGQGVDNICLDTYKGLKIIEKFSSQISPESVEFLP